LRGDPEDVEKEKGRWEGVEQETRKGGVKPPLREMRMDV
jgi:hypothetical protein